MLTRRITLEEFKRHATAHPWIGMNGGEQRHIEHPICPRCERIALRGTGAKGSWTKDRIARCPACGTQFKATMVLNEYLREELYRR